MKIKFHQMRVQPEYVDNTALNIKLFPFEFFVMTTVTFNAPETFQALMNCIFYDLIDILLVVCMDNLLFLAKMKILISSILKRSCDFSKIMSCIFRRKWEFFED